MLGEKAVRFSVAPISSAMAWKRLLKTSSLTGSTRMECPPDQHQIQMLIYLTSEIRKDQRCRTVFADNCRPVKFVAEAESGAIINTCFHTFAIDPDRAGFLRNRFAPLSRGLSEFRFPGFSGEN